MAENKKRVIADSLRRWYLDHPDAGRRLRTANREPEGGGGGASEAEASSATISLRRLDWLVTHLAADEEISWTTDNGRLFRLYTEYKTQLRSHTKELFDPFRRNNKMVLDGVGNTSLGQLNFFRWAHLNGVLEYAHKARDHIQRGMTVARGTPKVAPLERRDWGGVVFDMGPLANPT